MNHLSQEHSRLGAISTQGGTEFSGLLEQSAGNLQPM